MSGRSGAKPPAVEDVRETPEYAAAGWAYELAATIRSARLRAGLSQDVLARKMGTTQSNIARLEGGAHLPSIQTLHRLSDALGVHLAVGFVPRSSMTEVLYDMQSAGAFLVAFTGWQGLVEPTETGGLEQRMFGPEGEMTPMEEPDAPPPGPSVRELLWGEGKQQSASS